MGSRYLHVTLQATSRLTWSQLLASYERGFKDRLASCVTFGKNASFHFERLKLSAYLSTYTFSVQLLYPLGAVSLKPRLNDW